MPKTDTLPIIAPEASSPAYEADFHAWLLDQGQRLRRLRAPGIDAGNLAEEIEALGRSERRELDSRLTTLMMHLLKWQLQPEFQCRSWRSRLIEQRGRIAALLRDSPSLRPAVPGLIDAGFAEAVRRAAAETGLDGSPRCPWSAEQVLDDGFLP